MDGFKVSVVALQQRRCRAGICFGKDTTVLDVNEEQLKALQADTYLQVDVLTDDAATKQAGEETQSNTPNTNPPSGDGGVNPEPPKDEAPKDEAPKDEAPKDEAPKDEAPKDDLAQQLADAIRNSDIEVTEGKVPTVAEVKPLVDFDVNAALRDAAWELVSVK